METTGPHQPRSVEDRVRAHFADLDRREACDPPAFWRLSRAHVTGRDARIVGMSTRRLIIAALVCGLAILVAFAVQVWLVL